MQDTTWKFYTTSPETWAAMLEACEQARETIDLEQFIFTPDEIGNRFIEVCERKAAQGVKVRFIWDAAGSFTFFRSSIIEELKKKGIELVFFKTLLPGFANFHDYRSWYFRNHRRTLVVDNRIGFTGSICVSKRMENWRETHIRVEGAVVNDMQKAFDRMWLRAQNKRVPKIYFYKRTDREFEYVTNKPLPGRRRLYRQIVEAIRNSQKYIYITVPYFVPTPRLARVLRLAAHRGVEVKIILPQSSDYTLVDIAARTFFHSLLKSGVKIFLYQGKMLHCKTIVIDGDWSTVGTMNLDNISLLYNFEANLTSVNTQMANELAEQFSIDLQSCKEINERDWKNRFWIEKVITVIITIFRGLL